MTKGTTNNGENTTGNRNYETRQELTSRIIGSIARELNEQKAAKAAAERRLTQGNGKFIKAGSDDRVNGMEFNIWQYQTEDDQTSYWYGYTTHGGRRLLSVVEALEKEGKYEKIAQIAERDYNHGLEEHNLGMVANNSIYIEAYRKIASKGKSR